MILQEEMFCDEFHLVDLRVYDNCKKVITGWHGLHPIQPFSHYVQQHHDILQYAGGCSCVGCEEVTAQMTADEL